MFIQEWKNLFRNKIMVLSVVVLALIPIIYAGILLSSYWDPFGKTSNLAVAVINKDSEQTLEGTKINIGKELIENLKTNDDFDWQFVDEKTAQKGFKKGDYYVVITIPNDFSKNATTVLDADVKKMNLEYQVNPGRNYFIETIGKQAMAKITSDISQSVTKEYAKTIFSTIKELGDGLTEASDGAKQLDDGTEQAKNGSAELAENLKKLTSSTLTFQSGTEKIKVGIDELAKGANALNGGATDLHQGISHYTDGVAKLQQQTSIIADNEKGVPKLAASQNELSQGLVSLQEGGKTLEGGLNALNDQLPSNDEITQLTAGLSGIQTAITNLEALIAVDPNASNELKEQLATLKQNADFVQPKASEALSGFTSIHNALESKILPGTATLNGGLTTATDGSAKLARATNDFAGKLPALTDAMNVLVSKGQDLQNGSKALTEGSDKLATSIPTLTEGVANLTNATGDLHSATGLLADGSEKLRDGVRELKDGTEELSMKLTDGSDEINAIQTDETNHDMIASPVETDEIKANDVPNYGHALAPNFVSLALFVGAIAFNLIYPIGNPSMKITSTRAWWFSKFSIIFAQATSAALILDAVLLFVIHLEVANVGLFIFMSILVSLTYMSLVSFLVMAFDNPGRFIATILMVLQLASSGGMFPTELQSPFFQSINPFMLMTYSVYGFREAMTAAVGHSVFVQSMLILLTTMVVSNLLMVLAMIIKKKRNHAEVNVEKDLSL